MHTDLVYMGLKIRPELWYCPICEEVLSYSPDFSGIATCSCGWNSEGDHNDYYEEYEL